MITTTPTPEINQFFDLIEIAHKIANNSRCQLLLYSQIQQSGKALDQLTVAELLKAAGAAIEQAKEINTRNPAEPENLPIIPQPR
jgi:hypothetical protein